MSAVDYATPRAAVVAALSGLTGADLTIGEGVRDSLTALGSVYSERYTTAVGTAKDVWTAANSDAFDEADHLSRYIESVTSTAGAPLVFNAYDDAAIVARLSAALAAANSTQKLLVRQHISTRGSMWLTGPEGAGPYTSAPRHYDSKLKKSVIEDISVRTLELELVAKIAEATEWLAAEAYT